MLSLSLAQAVVNRALDAAARQNLPIAAAVVDAGGRVVAGARMDGAGYLAWQAALRKAQTAAGMGLPTEAIAGLAGQDPLIAGALHGDDDFFILPGGVPIREGGRVTGALGIAGGIYHQDQAIAAEALQAESVAS
ncbi:MAG TPA: heme-binding protein [Sphingomonadales bacterium]